MVKLCVQSSSWSKDTGTKAEKLMELEEVYQVPHCIYIVCTSDVCRWCMDSCTVGSIACQTRKPKDCVGQMQDVRDMRWDVTS